MTEKPGVVVDWQNVPYRGFREKLLTAAVSKDMPDVFFDGANIKGMYSSKGVIVPIEDYVRGWSGWDDMMEAGKDLARYNNHTWGIPFIVRSEPPIINTGMFRDAGLNPDNPPVNWNDVYVAASKTQKIENDVMLVAGLTPQTSTVGKIRFFDLMLQQNGGHLLSADNSAPAFNSKEGLEAVRYMKKIWNDLMEPAGVAPLGEAISTAYADGKAAIAPIGSSRDLRAMMLASNSELMDNTKVVVPFESGARYGKKVEMFAGGITYVSDSAEDPAEAVEFLKKVFEPEPHLKFITPTKQIPVLKSMIETDYVQTTPFFTDLMEYAKYGWELASTPEYPAARQLLWDEIEKAIFDKQTPEHALARGEEIWIKSIKEQR